MKEPEILEPDDQAKEQALERYALTVKVQSWATPIVGLVMLVAGLLAGYFVRPLLPGGAVAPTSVAQIQEVAPIPSGTQSAAAESLMKYLIAQAKHFKGNANAPVTLIEFGDFQ